MGEGGRVDLAQAQAARSVAVSELSLARADVKAAEAMYRQVIGSDPEKLKRPPVATNLPANLDTAYQMSVVMHPAILYAQYLVDASGYNVKAKEGALLPKVDFSATASYNRIYSGAGQDGVSKSIGLSLSVPIFEGGVRLRRFANRRSSLDRRSFNLIWPIVIRDKPLLLLGSSWKVRAHLLLLTVKVFVLLKLLLKVVFKKIALGRQQH